MKPEPGQEIVLVHKFSFGRKTVKVVRTEPDVVVMWPGCGESVLVDGHLADAPQWEVTK